MPAPLMPNSPVQGGGQGYMLQPAQGQQGMPQGGMTGGAGMFNPMQLMMSQLMGGGQGGQGGQGGSNPFSTGGSGLGSKYGSGAGSSIMQILSSLFGSGNDGDEYKKSADEYNKYAQEGKDYLMPWQKGGVNALGKYGSKLDEMSDPKAFMDKLMSGYSTSPYAKQLLSQGQTAQQNSASASGMLGSSALMKQGADYAQDLTSKDMQQYLGNLLGINKDYLSGQSDISHQGLAAGTSLADMARQQAEANAQMKYNQEAARNSNRNSIWGGIGGLIDRFI